MSSGTRRALAAQLSDELAGVVRRVLPSIVALSGEAGGYVCSGSGFVIDRAGHVVTNAHVVEDLRSPVDATLHGGAVHAAALVGADPLTDLAVLRLERPLLHHLSLRRAPAACGELCLALGNPLGRYPESVSLGIVSGVARTVYQEIGRPIYGSLQTDCAISPGNSGGPLVDINGRVIGVSVRKDRQADNIGFAIPADTVREVIAELMASGRVRRASLGVTVKRGSAPLGRRMVEGVEVVEAPAARSPGLRRGDLIVRIEGTAVRDVTDVVRLMTGDRIGRSVTVELVRDGERRSVVVRPRELRTPQE